MTPPDALYRRIRPDTPMVGAERDIGCPLAVDRTGGFSFDAEGAALESDGRGDVLVDGDAVVDGRAAGGDADEDPDGEALARREPDPDATVGLGEIDGVPMDAVEGGRGCPDWSVFATHP